MKSSGNILVRPVGTMDVELLKKIADFLEGSLLAPAQTGAGIPVPHDAHNPHRRQYLAPVVMEELKHGKNGNAAVIGVIDADLYAPPLHFVFGMADPQKAVAIISIQRLKEEFYDRPPQHKLFMQRVMKEALHEMGHLLFLDHCQERLCIMHFSNSMEDTDIKTTSFCPDCHAKLVAS